MATGVDAKLLRTTKFPPEFNQKVDFTKVNVQVIKKSVVALRNCQGRALKLTASSADGSPGESRRSWAMRMMLSPSYASISLKDRAM
jgi:hypothetical protein